MGKRSFVEEIDYRMAVARFNAALESCGRLQDDDREALLRQIAQQILSQLPNAPAEMQKAAN